MFDVRELYRLKIIALLHDPPHKPHLSVKKVSHEEEAKNLIKEVSNEEMVLYMDDERIKLADKLASSFDRWILSILMGEKYIPGLFHTREVKLKNILEPVLEVQIPEPKQWQYEEYVRKLSEIIRGIHDWKLKYHILYILYETLWISMGLSIGPADTRVPTHTVFDHNYATSTMMNWVYSEKGKIKGLLVGLDIVGVQGFISSSRKLRDMWASSYIVSALTWFTIIELVDTFGPDVVIMPSLRMNPFYLYWLKGQIRSSNIINVIDDIERLVLPREVRRMYKELGLPPYPIIPGRVTLVLPPWNVVKKLLGTNAQDIKEYLKERFKESWRLLWNATREYVKKRKDEEPLWRFIFKVFEYYDEAFKDAKFDSIPPLGLRLSLVEVSGDPRDLNLWQLYDSKYRELNIKLRFKKYRREDSAIELKLHKLTKKAFDKEEVGLRLKGSRGRGYDYCTCCGKLPAIIILPRDEEKYKEFVEEVIGVASKDLTEKELAHFRIVISPGEKLCPWCFMKRVISLEPRLLKTLMLNWKKDRLISDLLSEPKLIFGFPSLAHVASTRLYEKLLEEGKLYCWITKVKLNGHIPVKPEEWRVKPAWVWWLIRGLDIEIKAKELEKLGKGEDLLLYAVYSLDPEDMWFHNDRRRNWVILLRECNLINWFWRYYALIKADGDYIGDLLEGKLTAFLAGILDEGFYCNIRRQSSIGKEDVRRFLKRYIEHACEGNFKKFISFCIKFLEGEVPKEIKETWVKYIAREANIPIEEAKRRVERVIKTLRGLLGKELRIPVTPAYHIAVSSALIRAALLDIAIIAKLDGFVVYTGGDDLLAFAPVDKTLDVVYNTRLSFGGFNIEIKLSENKNDKHIDLNSGFLKLNKSHLPMLPSIGRSYCVYIAHYHYPLSLVLTNATKLLDNVKEDIKLHYYDEKNELRKSAKDISIIAYNPRVGTEEYTIIPLSWHRPIVQNASCKPSFDVASIVRNVKKLLKYIDERIGYKNAILSHSLLYDLKEQNMKDLISIQTTMLSENATQIIDLSKRVILSVIKRNIKVRYYSKAEEVFNSVFEPMLREEVDKKGMRVPSNLIGLGVFKQDEKDEDFKLPQYIVLLNVVDAVRLIRSGMR